MFKAAGWIEPRPTPVGVAALVVAGVIAVSTLFVKQHYLADVVGGAAVATVAWALLVRKAPAIKDPKTIRRGVLGALCLGGLYVVIIACFYIAYLLCYGAGPPHGV